MVAVGIVTTEIGVGIGSGIATECARLLGRRQIGMGEEGTSGIQNANCVVTIMVSKTRHLSPLAVTLTYALCKNVASVREAVNACLAMVRRRLPQWVSHP